MNCCQPHTIHYPTLESSNQPEFHQKKTSKQISQMVAVSQDEDVPKRPKMIQDVPLACSSKAASLHFFTAMNKQAET